MGRIKKSVQVVSVSMTACILKDKMKYVKYTQSHRITVIFLKLKMDLPHTMQLYSFLFFLNTFLHTVLNGQHTLSLK